MQKINKEKTALQKVAEDWASLNTKIEDNEVLLELAVEEGDQDTFAGIQSDVDELKKEVDSLELQSLLVEEADANSAYLSINSGAGGTEACDWAEMLFRMFRRYAEGKAIRLKF